MDRTLRIYLWLAFGITWGAGGLALLAGRYRSEFALSSSHPLYYLAGFGPSMVGFIMAGRVEGWTGLQGLLNRAVPSRAGLPWYLAVLDSGTASHAAGAGQRRRSAARVGSFHGEL